jgi:GntR family transcriptional regulator, uxu operon transcriptional repressor
MNRDDRSQKSDAVLIQLRAWLSRRGLAERTRLPPERVLCGELGVSRGELRKALSELEKEGSIWRHVGKGTFIGARPLEDAMSLSEVEKVTNPAEVIRARLILEPALARDAALHASREDMAELDEILRRARAADTWRHYEAQDNALHRAIARAASNSLTLALFDALNAVRRGVVWGRPRDSSERPPEDHHSHAEHDRIVDAIRTRDPEGAADAMRRHLRTVGARLLGPA